MIKKTSQDKLIGVGITAGVFFGGLLIIALIMNFIVMPLMVREGSETRVPDIVDLTLRAAEAKLQEAGLGTIKGNEEFDPERPKGSVISQRPEGGSIVKKGRRVILTISKGSASATVPKIEGYSLREARFLLEKEGLQPGGIIWLTDDTKPDGVIISTVPSDGTVMKLNAEVELLVNRRETDIMVTVPVLVGLDLELAKIIAEDNFLLVGELTMMVD
ncbi:MAG: PASTA domain-containing protein, partial [candidate division Zixibacteria bacterium]